LAQQSNTSPNRRQTVSHTAHAASSHAPSYSHPDPAWGCAATDRSCLRRPLPARASTDHRPPMRVALPPSCAAAPRRVVAYPSNPADPCWELACSGRTRTSYRHPRGRALSPAARCSSAVRIRWSPGSAHLFPPGHPNTRGYCTRTTSGRGGMSISRSKTPAIPGSGT